GRELGEGGGGGGGRGVEVPGVVLLDQEEERVPRRPPVGIAEGAERPRVAVDPVRHPRAGDRARGAPNRGSKWSATARIRWTAGRGRRPAGGPPATPRRSSRDPFEQDRGGHRGGGPGLGVPCPALSPRPQPQ